MKHRLVTGVLATAAALVFAGAAWAHAEISPTVVLAKHPQEFGLLVPTEKENLTTTSVEVTVPPGFAIDSFVPSPGWKRTEQAKKVTWSGGKVPTGEDAAFHFLATPNDNKTYEFMVRQTYSDGSIVDWNGPESSDTPAPAIQAKSSFGGSSSLLAIVALVVAGVALLLAAISVLAGGGRRPLA